MSDMYEYSYTWDARYCYPNSNVLKNKLGITEAEALHVAEREITSFKMAAIRIHGLPGAFDFKHLLKIHKYLFEDIYDWAGKVRQVDISKGNAFCHFAYIQNNANKLFQELRDENFLKNTATEDIPKRLSYYLSEINVIHPFREGNGRTQRIFIELLARERGFMVDFSQIEPREMIEASAESFYCSYGKMDAIFEKITTPLVPSAPQPERSKKSKGPQLKR